MTPTPALTADVEEALADAVDEETDGEDEDADEETDDGDEDEDEETDDVDVDEETDDADGEADEANERAAAPFGIEVDGWASTAEAD